MINPLRHYQIFQPEVFGNRRVDVIGAGATGSRVVVELVKLGVQNLHVWDFDHVESHNIANQVFGAADIGNLKAEAVAALAQRMGSAGVTPHTVAATPDDKFGEVVFLLTDTMASRKAIFDGAIKLRIGIRRLIETRMGVDQGRVYSIDPRVPAQINGWEKTLYEDTPAVQSACGTSITVGATAEVLAGLAVWQFIRWWKLEQGTSEAGLDNEIIFGLEPPLLMRKTFH